MKELIKDYLRNLKPYKGGDISFKTKLDSNENPCNLIQDFKQELIDEVFNELNRYPDSDSFDLRKALSDYTGVGSESIICGNGSDEIIKIIIDTFVDKGDTIVTHYPTFSMYKVLGQIAGGNVIEIRDDEVFNIQIDNMITAANYYNAKLIFLCNPNNPTGAVIGEEAILKILNNTKALVVVDEAYYEFYGKSIISKINDYKLLVLRTLSKAFGIAGLRVGYGVGNKELIEVLNRVKPPYNISTISQRVATKILQKPEIMNNSVNYLKSQRKYLIEELNKMDNIKVIPSSGNYILVKVSPAILWNLTKENIGIRDFTGHEMLDGYIRLSIGTEEENNKVLNAFKGVVA